jgi:lipopolysaccharide/colanic/teichoic acid biosynthesis glycosyltransferase
MPRKARIESGTGIFHVMMRDINHQNIFENEYLANARALVANLNVNLDLDSMSDQEVAVWYNDNVIYPDKVRLNCYYYRHYSFIKDIQMILCTVLGKKMEYAGETI